MESTLSTTTTVALFTVSKALNRGGLHRAPLSQCLLSKLLTHRVRCISNNYHGPNPFASLPLRILCAAAPLRRRLGSVSSSAASFASSGGSGDGGGFGGESGGGDGDGGGGENGSDGGDRKGSVVASGAEEVSAVSSDVIILDVGGMTCGGCAASVKRILESQPKVSSASVNLTTETAIVWPVSEAKVTPNWQQQLGEVLAKHLTSCGFTSNLRVAGQGAIEGDISP